MLPAYVSGTPHEAQYSAWNAPIQAAFARLHALTALDLSCNNLTSSNIHTLLAPHTHMPAPTHSDSVASNTPDMQGGAGDNQIASAAGADAALGAGSLHPWSAFEERLQSLDISGNTLTPPASLVGTLRRLTALTRLNVADTALRTADMQELAPALMCMTSMRWLSIGSNRITQRAAGALGRALARMLHLERLDASGHIMFQFGSAGAASTSPVPLGLPVLPRSFSNLPPPAAQFHHNQAAPEVSTVTGSNHTCSICVRLGADLSLLPAGMEALAPALGVLTALEHLDLRKQHMAAEGFAALAAHLAPLSRLTCLELDTNNLAHVGASELAAALSSGSLAALEVRASQSRITRHGQGWQSRV